MDVLSYLKDNILVLDGGMGTMLQNEGLKPGEKPELWSLHHPDIIEKIHTEYFNSGSNMVCTNTFGANILKFSEEELEKIIRAAVSAAKAARSKALNEKPKFIALDIGPTGKLLKPYGDFDFEDAVNVFAKTIKIGVSCGVDLIFIETMNDSYETKAALLAAKENSSLPIFVSNAYGEDGKLMTGASPEAMSAVIEGMGADAIGVNCSLGPDKLSDVVRRLLACSSIPVLMKPNAGLPKNEGGKTVYDISAEDLADALLKMAKEGVHGVGGCCGTTPEYIKALSEKIKSVKPVPIEDKDIMCVSSYTHAVVFGDEPILIGERINPTGKKRFKQALRDKDMGYILGEGIAQQERGVHILDVNVGLPEIDEKEMLKSAVCELQAVIDLPLQIDTSSAEAMEAALRRYNGKAMVNSVSGKESVMEKVFPLVKKYGGVVVALTLDDNGIPETAEGRLKIAEKILKTASKYGISRKNIVFDTLAMAVSAEPMAAITTLEALSLIKNRLGCRTSLGVSNISFGLPLRDAVNGEFFSLALENGLDAAIMNPYSEDMMKAYFSYRVIKGMDKNFEDYIKFSQSVSRNAESSLRPIENTAENPVDFASELSKSIAQGLSQKASQLTGELIKAKEPLDIVKSDIIPALDAVGAGFEKKTVYLPQLLMSAEAAKSSFEVIKECMAKKSGSLEKKCTVVIATVHGDIHDIGKNIVKLLLENYGFFVIDLGKDVPPNKVVEAVKSEKAPLVGLSALMTTTVPAMEETIRLLRAEAPWCRIAVGGAVMTEEYAKNIGADAYCRDAMETVRYAENVDDMR